jgi:hypothetical protein
LIHFHKGANNRLNPVLPTVSLPHLLHRPEYAAMAWNIDWIHTMLKGQAEASAQEHPLHQFHRLGEAFAPQADSSNWVGMSGGLKTRTAMELIWPKRRDRVVVE